EGSQSEGVMAGHCGLPFRQVVAGRLWHNAGAVGMPANDGTARAWFSLFTPRPDGLAIEHRALAYDHVPAAAKMRRAGLPEDYAAALENGLWPSCDVLPFKEIRERGVPLEPGAVLWRPPTARPTIAHRRQVSCKHLWPDPARDSIAPLPSEKFTDPRVTASGEPRAQVAL